jgi:hypothetical protein
MATTLSEGAKYTTNMVRKGVLTEIIRDDPIMQKLSFIEVVGNAYQYLRENTLPNAAFYDPNEVWAESTGDTTQVTATIRILGGDADADNFIQATRSDKTDIKADTIMRKAKAVKYTFLDTFWNGKNSVNPKQFDGLHVLVPSTKVTHEGAAATPGQWNASNMDIMLDMIQDGSADIIVVPKKLRRLAAQYLRAKGNLFVTDRNEYLKYMTVWNEVPIVFSDFLTITETISSGAWSASTGGASGTAFAFRFGTDDVVGLQNGGLTTKNIGDLESKDATRVRIKWYVGLALLRTVGIAAIDGIDHAQAMAD